MHNKNLPIFVMLSTHDPTPFTRGVSPLFLVTADQRFLPASDVLFSKACRGILPPTIILKRGRVVHDLRILPPPSLGFVCFLRTSKLRCWQIGDEKLATSCACREDEARP